MVRNQKAFESMFEGFFVGVELFGFEGRVHGQLGVGSKRVDAKSREDSSDKGKRLEHGAVPLSE